MTSTKRTRRAVAVGAFLVATGAAVAAPAISALTTHDAAVQADGQGQCLAWFGSRDTGKCIGWAFSNQPAWSVGTNGIGVSTGPMFPGQSWNSSSGMG